jgi:hypothetical protein
MGVVLDERGNVLEKLNEDMEIESHDPNQRLLNMNTAANSKKDQKQFTPIDKYKPTGNLVYNPEMFEKLEKKVTFV